MKIFNKIGIAILVFIVLIFIIALFIPKKYTVSTSEIIDKPHEMVYNYVRLLNNQTNYNVWVMADPDLNPDIIGTGGTVGAIQKWNSKIDDVGEGEQEITSLTPEKMEIDLRFKHPFESTAMVVNRFTSLVEGQTQIKSEFYANASYPFNLPSYIFGRKMIRKAQINNLRNLKNILENHD